jgi:hypothetical protein
MDEAGAVHRASVPSPRAAGAADWFLVLPASGPKRASTEIEDVKLTRVTTLSDPLALYANARQRASHHGLRRCGALRFLPPHRPPSLPGGR